MSKDKKITIQMVRSEIGFKRDQRQTLRGLGLRRIGSVSQLEDTPSVRGMINKVRHLVQVEEG
jgi:large subunit ribosomal protein L30